MLGAALACLARQGEQPSSRFVFLPNTTRPAALIGPAGARAETLCQFRYEGRSMKARNFNPKPRPCAPFQLLSRQELNEQRQNHVPLVA